jgi:hypothetical protein
MLQHRHPQPGVLDGEPDPGLHRGFGQAIGTPHHLREPPAAPRTEVPVPEADDLGGSEVEPVRQRVDGHHRVEQPRAAGQVVGGAQRRRHRDAVHGGDLVGREQVGAHHETRPGALPATRRDHLRRGVRRPAGRDQQLGCGPAAEHPAPLHDERGREGPQPEGVLDVGSDVDTGEQSPEAGAAQLRPGDPPGGDGQGATERSGEHRTWTQRRPARFRPTRDRSEMRGR